MNRSCRLALVLCVTTSACVPSRFLTRAELEARDGAPGADAGADAATGLEGGGSDGGSLDADAGCTGDPIVCDPTSTKLVATLQGTQEEPPNYGAGSGSATLWLNAAHTRLHYVVTHTLPEIAGAHLHTGIAGVNGPVRVPFPEAAVGSFEGTADVNAEIADLILAGATYVNLHVPPTAGQVIRGQVVTQGESIFVARITLAQTQGGTPSPQPAVYGVVQGLLNGANRLRVTGFAFNGSDNLPSPLTSLVIRRGMPTLTGSDVAMFSAGDAGATNGDVFLDDVTAGALRQGGLYVEARSALWPLAWRGQLAAPGASILVAKPVLPTAAWSAGFVVSPSGSEITYAWDPGLMPFTSARLNGSTQGSGGTTQPVMVDLPVPGLTGIALVNPTMPAEVASGLRAGMFQFTGERRPGGGLGDVMAPVVHVTR